MIRTGLDRTDLEILRAEAGEVQGVEQRVEIELGIRSQRGISVGNSLVHRAAAEGEHFDAAGNGIGAVSVADGVGNRIAAIRLHGADGVFAECPCEYGRVLAEATIDGVVALAAGEGVVAALAGEGVGAVVTGEGVVELRTADVFDVGQGVRAAPTVGYGRRAG